MSHTKRQSIVPITVRRLTYPVTRLQLSDLQNLQNQLYRGCEPLVRTNINAALKSKNTLMFVGTLPSGVIVAKGTVCLSKDELGVSARLENIVVDREHGRQGNMTKILNGLLSFVDKHNPYIVHLVTHPQRKDAAAFYKKYGFKESRCGLLILPT